MAKMCKIVALLLVLFSVSSVNAFRPQTGSRLMHHIKHPRTTSSDSRFEDRNSVVTDNASSFSVACPALFIPAAAASMFPSSCHALEGTNIDTQLPSAFTAYGHYLG